MPFATVCITSLDGRTLSLDFVFGQKHLEVGETTGNENGTGLTIGFPARQKHEEPLYLFFNM